MAMAAGAQEGKCVAVLLGEAALALVGVEDDHPDKAFAIHEPARRWLR